MSRHRSWLASVTRIALAGAIVGSVIVRTSAQDPWQLTYQRGQTAFDAHDYVKAEALFRDALAHGPKSHGFNTLITSQVRGFMPEYYLAIICAETNRGQEALKFAGIAEVYLDASKKDQKPFVDKLKEAEAIATKSLQSPPSRQPAGADANATRNPPPQPEVAKAPADPYAQTAANLRALLSTGRIDDAIRLRNQAAAGGASGKAFDDANAEVNQAEFNRTMTKARQDLAAGRVADARRGTQHARELGVDPAQVASLESEIAKADQPASPAGNPSSPTRAGQPPAKPPAPVPTPPAPTAVSPNAVVVDAQRRGLRALLSGDYQAAVDALKSAALDPSAPRARFYLACAEAGLALTEPDAARRANLESEAKRDWQAVATNRASFSADLTFVSPAIVRMLGIADR